MHVATFKTEMNTNVTENGNATGNGNNKQVLVGHLTNTAGGDLMWSQTDLLFANDFVPDTFADVPPERASQYENYREQKNRSIQKQQQLNTVRAMNQPVQPVVTALPDRQATYMSRIPPKAPLQPGPAPAGSAILQTREIRRKIFVDSKDRNTALYPDASDFVASWGRTFQNVKRLQLISLEFPNVVPSVTPNNNKLYWQNMDDLDLNPPYPVYSATVATGSYTLATIQTELTADMRSLKRHNDLPYPDGSLPPWHYFIVETNQQTNYVGFTSIVAVPADINPVVTTAGSSIIRFKQTNHGYETGDTIHILGVMGIVGGLSAASVTGAYTITKIDDNTFSYEVQGIAITSATGGGTLAQTGSEAPFQLLFGSYSNPIADILGFPVENSSIDVGVQDPLVSDVKNIVGVIPRGSLTDIVCPDHRLVVGDNVYLWNFNVFPSIYANDKHNGMFQVHVVPSPDVFTIQYSVEQVSDVQEAFVGTQVLSMYYPNHGFNRIVDIQQVGYNQVAITTKFDHGFTDKSKIRISQSNSVPSIDGYYAVQPLDDDTFIVSNADVFNPLTVTVSGYSGILASDYVFYLYNVEPVGGFTAADLNNVPFVVRDIVDADNFTFTGQYGFSKLAETGGGGGIRINSKLHGWAGTQSNSPGGVLHKPVKLSGDNYAYMCVPGLNSDSIATTSQVKDVFAKIFITAVPGIVIFNQFDSTPIDLPSIVPSLSELRFQIRTSENDSVSFNGLDYSFGLEVVSEEQVDAQSNTAFTALLPPGIAKEKQTT